MKRKATILILLFASIFCNGQIFDPIDWTYKANKITENEYEVHFIAHIDQGWALYSQFIGEGGPIPTTFSFNQKEIVLIGSVKESEENKVSKFDPVFNMFLAKYYKKAHFIQKVRLNGETNFLEGSISFMTCDETRCLAPIEETFKLHLTNGGINRVSDVNVSPNDNLDQAEINKILYGLLPTDIQPAQTNCGEKISSLNAQDQKGGSLLGIFLLGLIGGFLALLTPCVFPMIPLTISFFTKQQDRKVGNGPRKALLYGLFILTVYLVLSIPFHLLDSVNPDILNHVSTNPWLNLLFFAVFTLFAFSFFGFYNLQLPAKWLNKTTKLEGLNGALGLFFMALTLAIVSFSCTGPILGSLLAGSLTSDQGAWQLTAGMGGFGLALGLPFSLLAFFPKLLGALPRSGAWLGTTKIILGFLELALAFKFLSVADLVQHWGIVRIEVFLGVWILIFSGLSLYLFGVITFPHSTKNTKLSPARKTLGVLTGCFVLYLSSGFLVNHHNQTLKPLKLLSGLTPPVGYSFLFPNNCPNNLQCYNDIKTGVVKASTANKPILLDFTGYGCVNCRKMEEQVWPNPEIDELLRNEYVIVSLYVDDKKELPEELQLNVERANGGLRLLKNYGDLWAHFQTKFFNNNSQPFYVLLNANGERMLGQPIGYTPDKTDFKKFLECGKQEFDLLNHYVNTNR